MSKIFGKALPVATSNYAVNGNFDYWQRGSTLNGIATNTYSADRFWQATTQTGTINVTRQSIQALGIGSTYCLRIERTSGAGLGQFGIGQSIEAVDFNRLRGKTVTLSCLLRKGSSYTGNVALKIASRSLETRSAFAATNDIDVATAVVLNASMNTSTFVVARVSLTIPASSTASAIELQIYDNSTQAGASGAYFEVAQVQLVDAAIQPPAFIYAGGSIEDELYRCQRYYAVSAESASWQGYVLNGTAFQHTQKFPSTMRTTPAVVITNGTISGFTGANSIGAIGANSVSVQYIANATGGNAIFQFTYTADAEL